MVRRTGRRALLRGAAGLLAAPAIVGRAHAAVPIEFTVRPMLRWLGLLLLCLLVIAFVPALALWLPGLLGY